MAATSKTGRGNGHSNKVSVKELSILENGPQIIFCGFNETSTTHNIPASPPYTNVGTVIFPYLLENTDDYSVFLTTINGGNCYLINKITDENNMFKGFNYYAQYSCTTSYMVVKNGIRPKLETNL